MARLLKDYERSYSRPTLLLECPGGGARGSGQHRLFSFFQKRKKDEAKGKAREIFVVFPRPRRNRTLIAIGVIPPDIHHLHRLENLFCYGGT